MRIDLALLGDYAVVDKTDKLTVAGIFRAVFGMSFPFARPVMYLALIVTAEVGDDSDHKLSLRLIDPDGQTIIPELHADLHVTWQNPEAEATMTVVLELKGISFSTAGTHCFDIFLDDRFTERVPLEVGVLQVTESA